MPDGTAAKTAIAGLQGKELTGRALTVNEAKPPSLGDGPPHRLARRRVTFSHLMSMSRCMMIATAATLHAMGYMAIDTAADAARALAPASRHPDQG